MKLVCNVNLKTYIAIIGTANTFTIEIDIACIHNATKIKQQTMVTQRVGRSKMITVPTTAHFLKAATRQTAHNIGCRVVIIGFLVSCRSHPRLFYLKVMGYVNDTPRTVIV